MAAERKIKLGFVVYTDADNRPATGYLGDEVKVHKDDLERFDRLNVVPDIAQVAASAITESDLDEAVKAVADEKDAELAALQAKLADAEAALAAATAAPAGKAPAAPAAK